MSMIIFTNVRKSVNYKDYIILNVHPAIFSYGSVKGLQIYIINILIAII